MFSVRLVVFEVISIVTNKYDSLNTTKYLFVPLRFSISNPISVGFGWEFICIFLGTTFVIKDRGKDDEFNY